MASFSDVCIHFDQNPQCQSLQPEFNQTLGIGDRAKPGLDSDAAAMESFHDSRRVPFTKVDGGMVGQPSPRSDRRQAGIVIVLDPLSRADPDEGSGDSRTHSRKCHVDGLLGQTLFTVCSTHMQVDLTGSGPDHLRCVLCQGRGGDR
jgi:hypothetical protein